MNTCEPVSGTDHYVFFAEKDGWSDEAKEAIRVQIRAGNLTHVSFSVRRSHAAADPKLLLLLL